MRKIMKKLSASLILILMLFSISFNVLDWGYKVYANDNGYIEDIEIHSNVSGQNYFDPTIQGSAWINFTCVNINKIISLESNIPTDVLDQSFSFAGNNMPNSSVTVQFQDNDWLYFEKNSITEIEFTLYLEDNYGQISSKLATVPIKYNVPEPVISINEPNVKVNEDGTYTATVSYETTNLYDDLYDFSITDEYDENYYSLTDTKNFLTINSGDKTVKELKNGTGKNEIVITFNWAGSKTNTAKYKGSITKVITIPENDSSEDGSEEDDEGTVVISKEEGHFTLKLPSDMYKKYTETEWGSWMAKWETYYTTLKELTGYTPSQKIEVDCTKDLDVVGYGYQSSCRIELSKHFLEPRLPEIIQGGYEYDGFVHELSHLFQHNQDWQFGTEITNLLLEAVVGDRKGVTFIDDAGTIGDAIDIFEYAISHVINVSGKDYEIYNEIAYEILKNTSVDAVDKGIRENTGNTVSTNIERFEKFATVVEAETGTDIGEIMLSNGQTIREYIGGTDDELAYYYKESVYSKDVEFKKGDTIELKSDSDIHFSIKIYNEDTSETPIIFGEKEFVGTYKKEQNYTLYKCRFAQTGTYIAKFEDENLLTINVTIGDDEQTEYVFPKTLYVFSNSGAGEEMVPDKEGSAKAKTDDANLRNDLGVTNGVNNWIISDYSNKDSQDEYFNYYCLAAGKGLKFENDTKYYVYKQDKSYDKSKVTEDNQLILAFIKNVDEGEAEKINETTSLPNKWRENLIQYYIWEIINESSGYTIDYGNMNTFMRKITSNTNGANDYIDFEHKTITLNGTKYTIKNFDIARYIATAKHPVTSSPDSDDWDDDIDTELDMQPLFTFDVELEGGPGLQLHKVNENDEPLEATFSIYKMNDEDKSWEETIYSTNKETTTNEETGLTDIIPLEEGIYLITESAAPERYKPTNQYAIVTVDAEGKITACKIYEANKEDLNDKGYIENIDNIKYEELTEEQEVKEPVWSLDESVDGSFLLKVTNKKQGIQLHKVDEDNNPLVATFRVCHKNEEGKWVYDSNKDEYTTDKETGLTDIIPIEEGEYFIYEIKAPEGYDPTNQYAIVTVDKEGNCEYKIYEAQSKNNGYVTGTRDSDKEVTEEPTWESEETKEDGPVSLLLKVINKCDIPPIKIIKVDQDGNKIGGKGGKFQVTVTDENGTKYKLENSYTLNENGEINISLQEAKVTGTELTITVTETDHPEGYELLDPNTINFKIKKSEEGKWELTDYDKVNGYDVKVSNALIEVTVKNIQIPKEIQLKIQKVDGNTNTSLPGVGFTIEGDVKNSGSTQTTNSNGEISIEFEEVTAGKTYTATITETGKLEGYQDINPITIEVTINKDGTMSTPKITSANSSASIGYSINDEGIVEIELIVKNYTEIETQSIEVPLLMYIEGTVWLDGVSGKESELDNELGGDADKNLEGILVQLYEEDGTTPAEVAKVEDVQTAIKNMNKNNEDNSSNTSDIENIIKEAREKIETAKNTPYIKPEEDEDDDNQCDTDKVVNALEQVTSIINNTEISEDLKTKIEEVQNILRNAINGRADADSDRVRWAYNKMEYICKDISEIDDIEEELKDQIYEATNTLRQAIGEDYDLDDVADCIYSALTAITNEDGYKGTIETPEFVERKENVISDLGDIYEELKDIMTIYADYDGISEYEHNLNEKKKYEEIAKIVVEEIYPIYLEFYDMEELTDRITYIYCGENDLSVAAEDMMINAKSLYDCGKWVDKACGALFDTYSTFLENEYNFNRCSYFYLYNSETILRIAQYYAIIDRIEAEYPEMDAVIKYKGNNIDVLTKMRIYSEEVVNDTTKELLKTHLTKLEDLQDKGIYNTTVTDENGHFEFYGLNPDKKYVVKFTYNGMRYEDVDVDVNYTIGSTMSGDKLTKTSKATEDEKEREDLTNRFSEIKTYPYNYETKNGDYNTVFTQDQVNEALKKGKDNAGGDVKKLYLGESYNEEIYSSLSNYIYDENYSSKGSIVQFIKDTTISATTEAIGGILEEAENTVKANNGEIDEKTQDFVYPVVNMIEIGEFDTDDKACAMYENMAEKDPTILGYVISQYEQYEETTKEFDHGNHNKGEIIDVETKDAVIHYKRVKYKDDQEETIEYALISDDNTTNCKVSIKGKQCNKKDGTEIERSFTGEGISYKLEIFQIQDGYSKNELNHILLGKFSNDESYFTENENLIGAYDYYITYEGAIEGVLGPTESKIQTHYGWGEPKDDREARNRTVSAICEELVKNIKEQNDTTEVAYANFGVKYRPTVDLGLYNDVQQAYIKLGSAQKEETYIYDKRATNEGAFKFGVNEYDIINGTTNVEEAYANYYRTLSNGGTTDNSVGEWSVGEYTDFRQDEDIKYSDKLGNNESSVGTAIAKGFKDYPITIILTYKIRVINQSGEDAAVTEIVNYYDENFKFEKAYKENGTKIDTQPNSRYSYIEKETGIPEGYKTEYIEFGDDGLWLKNNESTYIYIELSMNTPRDTLLNNGFLTEEGYQTKNYAEINGYKTKKGILDIDSIPGNIVDDGQNRFDNGKYEDDEGKSPTFIIKDPKDKERIVEGDVFEDLTTTKMEEIQSYTNAERNGDGYLNGDTLIEGVIVDLIEVDDSGGIVDSDKDPIDYPGLRASVTTDSSGHYEFREIPPGNYIVKFTYGKNDETVLIKDYNGQYYNGGSNVKSYNGQDYENTIRLRNDSGNLHWYIQDVDTKISDASDIGSRRDAVIRYSTTLTNHKAEVFNSWKDRSPNTTLVEELKTETHMYAETNMMSVEVENIMTYGNKIGESSYIVENAADWTNQDYKYEITNVDFGIVERERAELQITKKVSYISIVDSSGTEITGGTEQDMKEGKIKYIKMIPNKDENMKDVNSTQGFVDMEIDTELLSGATLKITYEITVTNTSEAGNTIGEIQVVDYVSNNLNYDVSYGEGNSEWTPVTTDKVAEYLNSTSLTTEDETNKIDLSAYQTILETTFGSLAPGQNSTKTLTLEKNLSSEEDSNFNYENQVEIVQSSNADGRGDYSSIYGNLDPETYTSRQGNLHWDPIMVKNENGFAQEPTSTIDGETGVEGSNPSIRVAEKDSGNAEEVIITPPTGTTEFVLQAQHYILAIIGLASIGAIAILMKKYIKITNE